MLKLLLAIAKVISHEFGQKKVGMITRISQEHVSKCLQIDDQINSLDT